MVVQSNNLRKYFLKLLMHLFFWVAIFASVYFAYWGLQNSYFQQDEWYIFSDYNFLLSIKGMSVFIGNFLVNSLPHFAPLSLIFKMSLYRLFEFDAVPYFFVSIFIHFLVSSSVYLLIVKLTRKRFSALTGALFFAVNSSHHEAVTWIGTFEGTQFTVLFGSLSLFTSLIYLERRKRRFLFISLGLLLIALLFKETALTFFPILICILLWSKPKNVKIAEILSVISVLMFYLFLRFSYLFFGVQAIPDQGIHNQGNFSLIFIYNFLTSPIKIFAQILIPNEILIHLTNLVGPFLKTFFLWEQGPWVASNAFGYDFATIILGSFVVFSIFKFGKSVSNKLPIYLGMSIVLFTIFPLLILNRYLTYLDSRYFYPATLGFSLILCSLVIRATSTKNKTIIGLGLLALVLVLSIHLLSLKETVNSLAKLGQMRKSIINYIVNSHPALPSKTIFYTESDSTFYGLTENEKIMPFQSGFGQLLLVRYNPIEHFATDFFSNRFLWDITDQGYKEIESRGFGYFRDFDPLVRTMNDFGLDKASVIAYRYDSEKKSVEDITQEVQGRIDGYRVRKSLIAQIKSIKASSNSGDISWVIDKNRETSWSSKIPYSVPISVEVELNEEKRIAQIQIDSYNNKDQNEVGYKVKLSEDSQNWGEVFFSKRYPPDNSGIVNLYFIPTEAKYIKIEQAGYHKYAPWVVNELRIYESLD